MFSMNHTVDGAFSPSSHIVVQEGDVLDALGGMGDGIFDLIVSSPPYNTGKQYEEQSSLVAYLDWQAEVIAALYRALREGGSIVWQVGNYIERGEVFPLDIHFYPIFKNLGLRLRNRIVWHFEHGLHAKKRFSGRYETMLWFTKGDGYTFNLDAVRVPSKYPGKLHYKGEKAGQPSGNPLGKNPSDYWKLMVDEWELGCVDVPNVKANHPEKTEHPCQFPVELMERCVLALSNEGDWVLDPFGGVGSSVIAAIKHGRRAMMVEKQAQYVAIARERITAFQNGTLKIRPLGKPIYQPTGREKVASVPDAWLKEKQRSLL